MSLTNLTARHYFAAKAMAALIAKMPLFDRMGEHGIAAPSIEEIHGIRRDIAQSAYDYADAMLEEHERPRGVTK